MKPVFILFLFPFLFANQAFAIDTGDGSDGACVTSTFTAAVRNYQCTTLILNTPLNVFKAGVAVNGGAIVVIKVQGLVEINSTIDLSGASGNDGIIGAAALGGRAGAGAGAGGDSSATNGLNGNGVGKGLGGAFAPVPTFSALSFGGGGGGGSFNTPAIIQAVDGDVDGDPIVAGANGASYFPEIDFEANFSGGSGGAAGGSGADRNAPATWFGSSGGGGGGAIHIVAGADISINGTIISAGGNGGGDPLLTDSSGGGGGGSGGAIWLQAAGSIFISGTSSITAPGGTPGENTSGFSGLGGAGGEGRIRLDDSDGVVVPEFGAIIAPNAVTKVFTPTVITSASSAISRQYSSSITCGRVALENEKPINNLINLFLGMMIASMIYFSIPKKGKI